jgi:multiple sugar transport system substrate-binding protein
LVRHEALAIVPVDDPGAVPRFDRAGRNPLSASSCTTVMPLDRRPLTPYSPRTPRGTSINQSLTARLETTAVRSSLTRRDLLAAGSDLAAAPALPAVSGCSSLVPADSDPDTLVVHTQLGTTAPGSPTYLSALDRFRKENPGLKVKNLINGDDLGPAWTDVDVGPYLDDWGLRGRVLPAALAAWTDNKGRLRAFPCLAANWPGAYNRALLARAGVDAVPTTGDELTAAARRLRASGIAPVTVGGNGWTGQKLPAQIIQTFLTPEEARHVYSTGDFGIRGAREGIEYFTHLRDAGVCRSACSRPWSAAR